MKDFCKWLGVNEKIAKLIVWLFIIMAALIIVNTALESLGLPFYKITYENIVKMNANKILEHVLAWLVAILNFYSVALVVFDFKDLKPIFKYCLLYVITNIIVYTLAGYVVGEIYLVLYFLAFCYFYSHRNKKYILYSVVSILLNFGVQYVCYLYKVRFIDFASLDPITKNILGIDFFIIMAVIICIKEIIKKNKRKRSVVENAN